MKVMKIGKYVSIIAAMFLTACTNQIETNMSEPMVDFEFITQDNDTLSLKKLEGEWWIANFMYTNCRAICPMTTANLVEVQKRLAQEDLQPHIVSFSVDPIHDTPEVLKEYAEEHGVDLDTWDFLTGYDFQTIQNISENTFKSALREGGANQRSHGFHFYVINPNGKIIKKYDGTSSKEIELLIDDLITLL